MFFLKKINFFWRDSYNIIIFFTNFYSKIWIVHVSLL